MSPSHVSPNVVAAFASQPQENPGQAMRAAAQQMRAAAQRSRDMQQAVRDVQQQVRDAQQRVRDAEQQVRESRTPDQRGAAEQALAGARIELGATEAALRSIQGQQSNSAPVIWTGQPSMDFSHVIPPQVVDISIGFFITLAVIVVGLPISRALGRRMDRRSSQASLPPQVGEQLQRIEYSVEAMSIEIQRIAESQRTMAEVGQRSLTHGGS